MTLRDDLANIVAYAEDDYLREHGTLGGSAGYVADRIIAYLESKAVPEEEAPEAGDYRDGTEEEDTGGYFHPTSARLEAEEHQRRMNDYK